MLVYVRSVVLVWCFLYVYIVCVFKQKTAYEMRISDWSSDVCSSDLRLVRDDAVIDVHREQGQREAEQVDHQRRAEHRVEGTAHPPPLAPEPVALRRDRKSVV